MEPPFYSPDLITMKKKFFAKYSSDYELHSSSHNAHHRITTPSSSYEELCHSKRVFGTTLNNNLLGAQKKSGRR